MSAAPQRAKRAGDWPASGGSVSFAPFFALKERGLPPREGAEQDRDVGSGIDLDWIPASAGMTGITKTAPCVP